MATAAYAVGVNDVLLVAPISSDLFGSVVRSGLETRGLRSDGLVTKGDETTATCGLLLDENSSLIGGVADMSIALTLTGEEVIEKIEGSQSGLVAFDGNLAPQTIATLITHCRSRSISTFFEPTSNINSLRILTALELLVSSTSIELDQPYLDFASPNIHELKALYNVINNSELAHYELGSWFDSINVSSRDLEFLPGWIAQEGIVQMGMRLMPLFRIIFIKCSERGVVVLQRISGKENLKMWDKFERKKGIVVASDGMSEAIIIKHFAALELDEKDSNLGSTTGAGDSMAGAILAMLTQGLKTTIPSELDRIIEVSQKLVFPPLLAILD